MLRLPPSVRIMLCLQPADMRRSFDGLCGMVQSTLEESPTSGHLFVFRNRRCDRIKILWWDRDGFAIFYKRLERGTFHLPSLRAGDHPARIELSPSDFAMILEGFDLASVRKKRRFSAPVPGASA
jgi:transposase